MPKSRLAVFAKSRWSSSFARKMRCSDHWAREIRNSGAGFACGTHASAREAGTAAAAAAAVVRKCRRVQYSVGTRAALSVGIISSPCCSPGSDARSPARDLRRPGELLREAGARPADQKKCPGRLRRVVYRTPEGDRLELLTNHMTLGASTVARIYKDRWQIELFFKALTQNLRVKTFVGTSANALVGTTGPSLEIESTVSVWTWSFQHQALPTSLRITSMDRA